MQKKFKMHSEPLLKRNLGHILLKSIWTRKFDIFESNHHHYIEAFVAATICLQVGIIDMYTFSSNLQYIVSGIFGYMDL